jgi:hypothetical protein
MSQEIISFMVSGSDFFSIHPVKATKRIKQKKHQIMSFHHPLLRKNVLNHLDFPRAVVPYFFACSNQFIPFTPASGNGKKSGSF